MELTKETRIGRHWYPLRAIALAATCGAATGILATLALAATAH